MKPLWLGIILLSAARWLGAQGTPELGLDVNGQSEAVVSKGWPLLVRVVVIAADNQPVSIGLSSGAWTQALRLTITDPSGTVQNWPVQLIAPVSNSLSLSGIKTGEAVWLVSPTDTVNLAAGLYSLSVVLNTTASAGAGTWSGTVQSNGATLQIQAEPASLSAEDEASKYLALAAYARLRGDATGAKSALDTLISHQPDILEAYSEKADLLAAAGDYAGALALSQQALDKFKASHPNAAEAPVILNLRAMAMADKLAAQQRQSQGGNTVTSVEPGSTATVLTPESIVTAYGAKLATGTVLSSGSLTTTLGGTTVTITDSAGAAVLAPLFYVSALQVNYEVPGTVALGKANVTVKSGDGTTSTGTVTIADVQPGLFTFNSDGLVTGRIVRVAPDGQQTQENVYVQDSAGNILATPVDVTNGQVFLVFYGTGLRRAPADQVTVSIGGVNAPLAYAGPQGSFVGLDQVNVVIPASLAGRGDVPIVLTAAGKQANTVRITIK
jgi:uncharacterized protein (TIGR03437 family)